MKIASSEVQYYANTTNHQQEDQKTFIVSVDGQKILREKNSYAERRSVESSAQYQSNPDYVVEIRDQEINESTTLTEARQLSDTDFDLDDEFEKNLYLYSVLNWAANAIEGVVSAHETEASQELENIDKNVSELNELNTSDKALYSFYRSMAHEIREQAKEYEVEGLTGPREGIRDFKAFEREDLRVYSHGSIKTADGKEISFSMKIDLSREQEIERIERFRLVDPLIVNFSASSADLSDKTFEFDLDNNGTLDQIHQLKSGSGFLVLDLNNDQKVNNGGELFGTATGNGFEDLSFYDKDNNQWIDENDPVYDKLRIWIKNDETDSLARLSDYGIGAIHLGSVDSSYQIKGQQNETLAQISANGIAVTESGEVRSVQQIDFVV